MKTISRDFWILHGIYLLVLCAVLLAPIPFPVGQRFFLLVVVYNLALPLVALRRGHRDWLPLWVFTLLLSILQVIPDWYLSARLHLLAFPDDGFVKIGTVSAYMAGLWVMPLFVIVHLARQFRGRAAYGVAALAALVIFGGSEQFSILAGSWHAINVEVLLGNIAVYVLVPEVMLGVSALYAFRLVERRALFVKLWGALQVMILYLGNLALFSFLIE